MVKYLDNNSGFNQWAKNKQASNTTTAKKSSKLSSFLWWMVIFMLAWWLFSIWFGPNKKTETVTPETAVVEDISNVPVSAINSEKVNASIQGLRVSKIELKNYIADKKSDDDKPVTLFGNDNECTEIGLLASGTTAPTAGTVWKSVGDSSYTWSNSDKIKFTRNIIVNDYIITVRDEIVNNSDRDVTFAPYARMVRAGIDKNVTVATGGVAYANNDIERESWSRLNKKSYAFQTTNGFVGFADQYWQSAVSIGSPDQTMLMKKHGDMYHADAAAQPVQIAAGKTSTIETKIFAGPREQKILNTAAESIPGLNKTMDYGWFFFLSRPMLWALNALHGLVLNYGLAIILLTLALRLLMWPLTRKSYTSMAAMQKMQPELARIQKTYANDKARQQMEMMKLYQTHKTSPMSGCLPMLIQIPIFFALYKALLISVPMRMASFLWIPDLSLMDPYFVLPILMGATMWWQQTLQTAKPSAGAANDPMAQTQKIMKWMPIMFTIMFAWMPAGLVLYWTVSNLFGIAQMYIIKKSMSKKK